MLVILLLHITELDTYIIIQTVLGEAIKEGDPKTVKRLISKGENVLLEDRVGSRLLKCENNILYTIHFLF